MTIGLIQDMSSPNVAVGYLVPEFEVWNLQYATLTDKAADDFATIPGLAESWEGSDDGLTWTYTLREGLKWSDGEPLTAEDIAYTINRSRDEEWINHYSTVQNLEATALDERTVEIVTSVPDPKLPTMDVYIVPKHVYESISADDLTSYDALDGVASGQYSLDEWRSGQDWTMVKNPNWYGRDNGIDRIVFRVFSNPDAMVAALAAGRDRRRPRLPGSTPSSNSRPTRTSRSSPDCRAASPSWRSTAWPAGSATGTRRCRTSTCATPSSTPSTARAVPARRPRTRGGRHDDVAVGRPELDPRPRRRELRPTTPTCANEMLDEAGYLDTDGDGVREMPDGSRPLEFRYVERSESEFGAADPRVHDRVHGADRHRAGRRGDGRHPALRRPGRAASTTCSCGAGRRSSTPTRCCRTSRATR